MKPDDFPDRAFLCGFEGGVVYTAEREGRFYVIQDESAMADLLGEEDQSDLELVKIFEFGCLRDRSAYLETRGWAPPETET